MCGRDELQVLPDHLIGFDRRYGNIVFVRPASELESLAEEHKFHKVFNLKSSQFLMPGLVDAHFHPPEYHKASLSLEGGFGLWSVKTMIPGELRFRNVTFAAQQSAAFVREQLRLGTTTAGYMSTVSIDSNFELARVINRKGMRAIIGKGLIDQGQVPPAIFMETTEQAIENVKIFIDRIRRFNNTLLQPAIGLYGDFAISEELQKGLADIIAKDSEIFVMAHWADARPAYKGVLAQWLSAGILPANRSLMVHSVNLRESEIQMYPPNGLSIAHCPATLWNLRFGNYLDVRRMWNLGVNVALGSDVAAGVSPFILRTMRVAHHVSRAVSFNFTGNLPADYAPLTIDEVFYLATLGGAQAIALSDRIGNFEVGKQFDALLIDTQAPSQLDPVFYTSDTDTLNDSVTKFLWNGDERNILKVWVGGKLRSSRCGTPTSVVTNGDDLPATYLSSMNSKPGGVFDD